VFVAEQEGTHQPSTLVSGILIWGSFLLGILTQGYIFPAPAGAEYVPSLVEFAGTAAAILALSLGYFLAMRLAYVWWSGGDSRAA